MIFWGQLASCPPPPRPYSVWTKLIKLVLNSKETSKRLGVRGLFEDYHDEGEDGRYLLGRNWEKAWWNEGVRWKVLCSCWLAPDDPNPGVWTMRRVSAVFTAKPPGITVTTLKKEEHFLQAEWYVRWEGFIILSLHFNRNTTKAANDKAKLGNAVQ